MCSLAGIVLIGMYNTNMSGFFKKHRAIIRRIGYVSIVVSVILFMIWWRMAGEAGTVISKTHIEIVLTSEAVSWMSFWVFSVVVTNLCFFITTLDQDESN